MGKEIQSFPAYGNTLDSLSRSEELFAVEAYGGKS
jgi:hypothetical protein